MLPKLDEATKSKLQDDLLNGVHVTYHDLGETSIIHVYGLTFFKETVEFLSYFEIPFFPPSPPKRVFFNANVLVPCILCLSPLVGWPSASGPGKAFGGNYSRSFPRRLRYDCESKDGTIYLEASYEEDGKTIVQNIADLIQVY